MEEGPTSNASAHLLDGQVSGFLDGSLAPETRRQVEAHLDQCPSCRRELAAVSRLAATAPPDQPEQSIRRLRLRLTPALLAGLAAAALAGLVLVRTIRPPSRGAGRALRTATSAEALGAISAVAPTEDSAVAAGTLQFIWNAVNADTYRFTLLTETGEPIWSREAGDTTVILPPSVVLMPGRLYFWRVDAIGLGVIATTGARRLRVLP